MHGPSALQTGPEAQILDVHPPPHELFTSMPTPACYFHHRLYRQLETFRPLIRLVEPHENRKSFVDTKRATPLGLIW